MSFCSNGKVPVLVALVPPEVLQAAPELMRLLDAADFLAAGRFGLGRELGDQPAQRLLQPLGKIFVVGAEGSGARCGGVEPSIGAGHAMACPYGGVGCDLRGSFDWNESPRLVLPTTWEPFLGWISVRNISLRGEVGRHAFLA